ncbi:MAG: 4Fe-4S binding protein [Verrucomicrobiales bacterium]|nr:4Fe-4S binding protein [Verrucomicrobiales bacterium]
MSGDAWGGVAIAMAIVAVLAVATSAVGAAELRFPPPDFESGYAMPETTYPAARAQGWEWFDAIVLLGVLATASFLVYGKRSRSGVAGLSAFSLLYFGFYREGCVCAIGSVQNVALATFGSGYALPVAVGVFFAAPLVAALFLGRTFCAAVCPHGALQDWVLIRPVKVPRWLESGLGVLPFVYLGAGVTFAATGAAFVICRFDPFVPIFRMSGSTGMLLTGGALLALGMFVGRPYCRFLCPYGALLKVAAALSKWRVRITPDVCTQCRLCPDSCPFGIIREPDPGLSRPKEVASARRRIVVALVVFPVLAAAGAAAGWVFGGTAARLHPTVALVEDYGRSLERGLPPNPTLAEKLALQRAERQSKELLPRAEDLRGRFRDAGLWFGVWCGLVIGVKWISLGMARRRDEFQPDRTACFACARCFASCPQERIRRGWLPTPEAVVPHPVLGTVHPVPAAKSGGCGCGAPGGER